jgi:hypothetical protein
MIAGRKRVLCRRCDVNRTKTLRFSRTVIRNLNETHESHSSEPPGVRGVGSSNLPVPTNNLGLNDYFWRSILWRISGHNSLMMLLREAASSWVAQFSAVFLKPRSCAG